MWITGFDVPCLTMLYNDKPLSKHTLIQTISRVNRKFGTKRVWLYHRLHRHSRRDEKGHEKIWW
ncbi:MAG: UvrB domain 3-containing protein [Acutalibacteraceae bacterium]